MWYFIKATLLPRERAEREVCPVYVALKKKKKKKKNESK